MDLVCVPSSGFQLRDSKLCIPATTKMRADEDSGQNESIRSKFPSWFLQDTLLGFFEIHCSSQHPRDWRRRWRRNRCYLYHYAKNVYAVLLPFILSCIKASCTCLTVIRHLPPCHVFTEFLLSHLHHLSHPLPPICTHLAYRYT